MTPSEEKWDSVSDAALWSLVGRNGWSYSDETRAMFASVEIGPEACAEAERKAKAFVDAFVASLNARKDELNAGEFVGKCVIEKAEASCERNWAVVTLSGKTWSEGLVSAFSRNGMPWTELVREIGKDLDHYAGDLRKLWYNPRHKAIYNAFGRSLAELEIRLLAEGHLDGTLDTEGFASKTFVTREELMRDGICDVA